MSNRDYWLVRDHIECVNEIERLETEIEQYKKICDDWEIASNQSIVLIKETQLAAIAEMKRVYPKSGCYQVLEAYFGLKEA